KRCRLATTRVARVVRCEAPTTAMLAGFIRGARFMGRPTMAEGSPAVNAGTPLSPRRADASANGFRWGRMRLEIRAGRPVVGEVARGPRNFLVVRGETGAPDTEGRCDGRQLAPAPPGRADVSP